MSYRYIPSNSEVFSFMAKNFSLAEQAVPDHRVENEVQSDWRSKASRQAIEHGQDDRADHDLQNPIATGAEGVHDGEESGTQKFCAELVAKQLLSPGESKVGLVAHQALFGGSANVNDAQPFLPQEHAQQPEAASAAGSGLD